MPVETAADLAGMFDDAEFAERARYQAPAGGDWTACLVIVDRGHGRGVFDAGMAAGRKDARSAERMLWAQRSELATIARNGVFEMLDADDEPTGEAFTVAALPRLDHTGALWSCELLIRS